MARFIVFFLIGTALVAALIIGLFRAQGIDIFAPEVRTIAALGVVVAVYAGVRIAMIAMRYLDARAQSGGDEGQEGGRKRSAFYNWGRSAQLDARLDARRARLARSKTRAGDGPGEGSGDEGQ